MSFAMITGAAKGIGRALAEELAFRKYNLILVDKEADELYALTRQLENRYIVQVIPFHIDLSSIDGVEQVVSFTQPYHEWLSVVVNNAGCGLNGAFEQISISNQLSIINTNIKALVKISDAYIPILKKFDKAYLLNVTSTTRSQSTPYFNVYESTKAFVLSFTRGIRNELRNSNLSVSCLSSFSMGVDDVNRLAVNNTAKRIVAKYSLTPESVANIAIDGLFKGEHEIVPGLINKLITFLPNFFYKKAPEKTETNIYKPKDRWIDPAVKNIFYRSNKIRHSSVHERSLY